MVTVLTFRHLKYKINENDHNPPHVHVEGGGAEMRINLITLEIMDEETDFSKSIIWHILDYVRRNRLFLLDRWEMIHGKKN